MTLQEIAGNGPVWDLGLHEILRETNATWRDDIRDTYHMDANGIMRLETVYQYGNQLYAIRYVSDREATVEVLGSTDR